MEFFRIGVACEYLLQFVTILPSMHVETGQTSEKRVAVLQTTAHQGICCQDSSLASQVLSNPPGITHLDEASVANILQT